MSGYLIRGYPTFDFKETVMLIFTEDWASVYQTAINANPQYAITSKNWSHGVLAMAIIFDDNTNRAVCLDLANGECLSAKSMTLDEVMADANFVIEGDVVTWKTVLNGDIQPLMAIMRGELKLSKGSIGKLMPFAKSAIELVNSAQTLDTEFPD